LQKLVCFVDVVRSCFQHSGIVVSVPSTTVPVLFISTTFGGLPSKPRHKDVCLMNVFVPDQNHKNALRATKNVPTRSRRIACLHFMQGNNAKSENTALLLFPINHSLFLFVSNRCLSLLCRFTSGLIEYKTLCNHGDRSNPTNGQFHPPGGS
jgi:hypothetical protein